MKVSLPLIVRSTEIDVNGHVNNAKYLEYFEWGREEWYEQSSLAYDVFLEMGIQTVTVNINVNYRQESTQGDELTVTAMPESIGHSSYIVYQEIINQAGDVVADARVTSVTMDINNRQSTQAPELLRRQFT